ncbi:MAG: GNAT family N-acetyltransferase [Anaerolineaceae bacterium]|nr:GNAT family N-acetyltransferase [Anaerolineaceae bacterium]NTV37212.1 GNAT family N-acetyltransferase [Anaerolineaceae bacterium]
MTEIRTRRVVPDLILRDAIEADIPIFFEYESDPQAVQMAAFTSKDPTDRAAHTIHWTKIMAIASVKIKTILADGVVVGSVLSYEDEGHTEVSYWIGRPYWGRGIATAALKAFMEFQTVRPLYARAAKDNLASIRVLQKCGFAITAEEQGFANARGQEIAELVLQTV